MPGARVSRCDSRGSDRPVLPLGVELELVVREALLELREVLPEELGELRRRLVRERCLSLAERDELGVRAGQAAAGEADVDPMSITVFAVDRAAYRRDEQLPTVGADVFGGVELQAPVEEMIFLRDVRDDGEALVPFELTLDHALPAVVEQRGAKRAGEGLGHVRGAAEPAFRRHEPARMEESTHADPVFPPEPRGLLRGRQVAPGEFVAAVRVDELVRRRDARPVRDERERFSMDRLGAGGEDHPPVRLLKPTQKTHVTFSLSA